MKDMWDCNGKRIHEDELVKVINRPDIDSEIDFWVVFACLQYGVFIDFVLKHCVTDEIKIVSQANIKRTY
jgi:hypothetical protein